MYKYIKLIFILCLFISCSNPQYKEIISGKIIDKKEIIYWNPVIQQYINKTYVNIYIDNYINTWISSEYLYKTKNIGDSIWFNKYKFDNYIKIIEKRY